MRPTNSGRFLSMAAVLTGVAIAWTAVPGAQGRGGAAAQQAPQRTSVQVVQVKPDMVGTYQDLIKNELIPALKKAGIAYRWTFANGPVGGQGFTFTAVQPVTSFAQYDQPAPFVRAMGEAGAANYNAKLRATLVSTHTYIQTLRQDLSIQSNSPTAPPLAQVQTIQVAPGKNAEFTSIMTTDFLPNYKKAGVKDFWVFAVNFGAPGGQLVMVRGLSKYADLDVTPGLLQRAGVSPEAAQKINERRGAISSLIDNAVVRFVPDLSFGSPTARPVSH
jgi:hypothetical protein